MPQGIAYVKSTVIAVGLTALLAACWIANGRSLLDLGMGVPDKPGMAGIALALIIPLGMVIAWKTGKEKPSDDGLNLLPKSRSEFFRNLPYLVIMSAAWEILYRGALMFYFTPFIGVIPAMIAAGVVYTIDHGSDDLKGFVLTYIVAFFFLALFVLSGSLWGPIILHVAIPVVAGYLYISAKDKDRSINSLS